MAPQKIILDTDPGVDDVLAILLSLASPEVDVRLISIVFGNTHAPVAHSNLLKIYHALAQEIEQIPSAAERYRMQEGKRAKTILALGEDGPIGGEKAVAAYFVSHCHYAMILILLIPLAWSRWIIEHLGDSSSFHT